MITPKEKFIEIIKECVNEFLKTGNFFNKFYRVHGNAYFFLFKKSLRITNIQYPELTSLIKMFSKSLLTD